MEVVGTSRQGTSGGNGDASIDMERLVLSCPSPECCIYKVPKALKKIKEDAYTPLIVSIGPLHHGKKGLKDMEEHKLRYFKDFIQQSGKSLKELVKIVEEKEKEIRECYAETINLKSKKLLEIILVDAAFVVEVLLKHSFGHRRTPNDRIFGKPWMINDIRFDLLLLENQLPLFVLQDLFEMATVNFHFFENETLSSPVFCLIALFFFGSEMIQEFPVLDDINLSEVKHILDFLRICLIPKQSLQPSVSEENSLLKRKQIADFLRSHLIPKRSLQQTEQEFISMIREAGVNNSSKVKQFIDFLGSRLIPRQSLQQTEREFGIPSATELHEAGVKFKVCSSKNLFDIKFDSNVLEIPHTKIVDSTERVLRNIIAYEQRHCDVKFFADYTLIMDYLINTSKDVELLVKARVIENWLSDNNDVSNLYNGLGKEVVISSSYYFTKLHKELNEYRKIRKHRWQASLRHHYCNTPWRILSIFVAAILLGLTFIQSLCSLVSCHK